MIVVSFDKMATSWTTATMPMEMPTPAQEKRRAKSKLRASRQRSKYWHFWRHKAFYGLHNPKQMKTSILFFAATFFTIQACAQTPTAEEQQEKIWAAKHINPEVFDGIASELEWCSNYVGRTLRRDEWMTDFDIFKILLTVPAINIYALIDQCAFYMPKSLQLKWVKFQIRKLYRPQLEESKGAYPVFSSYIDPYNRQFCSKKIMNSLLPDAFLAEEQFQALLRNTKPQESLGPCFKYLRPSQHERWLDHQALYLLNYAPRPGRTRDYTNGWH